MINKNPLSLSDTISPEFKALEDLISKYTISSFSDDSKVVEYTKISEYKLYALILKKMVL